MRTKIADVLKSGEKDYKVVLMGWVKSFRNNQFVALNDGSTIHNIQVVIDFTNLDHSILSKINVGACIKVKGLIKASLGKGQNLELIAENVEILGEADAEKYPLQPKKHSLEFLREIAHLRFRTNTFSAVFRVRHAVSQAIHSFFNEKGFVYIHAPIITSSDAEGAGEMFRVTTLDAKNPPLTETGEIDYTQDFFGKATNLTVSGQLEAELAALALGEVYTFGPTFRAENSNTTRHLAEFWMIEPEMAFYDLNMNMDLAEAMLKSIIQYVLTHCKDDLEFLNDRLIQEEKQKPEKDRSPLSLIEKLNFCLSNPFVRITYTEAVEILINSPANKKKKFKFPIEWGIDLQSEHERYLVEQHFASPVILTDYPKDIKAFYMRLNDDQKTVRAMDILFPGIGEIIGGSQREERLENLMTKMTEMQIPHEEMYWYLDTRRYGSCVHSGFGLGFERMVQFITGMGNIRDVIPFARTPKNCEF